MRNECNWVPDGSMSMVIIRKSLIALPQSTPSGTMWFVKERKRQSCRYCSLGVLPKPNIVSCSAHLFSSAFPINSMPCPPIRGFDLSIRHLPYVYCFNFRLADTLSWIPRLWYPASCPRELGVRSRYQFLDPSQSEIMVCVTPMQS